MKITLDKALLFFATFFSFAITAQTSYEVTGRVVESGAGDPVPYASVFIKEPGVEDPIAATTTGNDGQFRITSTKEDFYVEITFFGYETERISSFTIQNGVISLGTVSLKENSQTIGEVDVTVEKSSMEFRLDKRVFNVGQDLASTGMGAMDLLNNVPSVNVDIEGQISLRGNSGVQILINGKPSVLSDEGSNALGTLSADMIERVEVITNPSAKYEAEGSSGIINIILKKDEKKGFNGSVSLNTGIPHNHSVGVSLNRRTEDFNFFTQLGGGYRSLPRYNEAVNYDLVDSNRVESDGVEYRNEQFFNITVGSDYYIDSFNIITLSGNFAFEDESQPSETNFQVFDGDNQLISEYRREEETSAGNPKYQYDLQYERQFRNNEDHVLQFSTQGSFFGKSLTSDFQNVTLEGVSLNPNQKTETEYFQQNFIYKADYTNPITDAITLEAGAQYELNDVGNDYAVFNETSGGDFVLDSGLTNNFEFDQKVFGVYATGSYEATRWGVKVGARIENTDLNTVLTTTNEVNMQNYTNLFPSAHVSFEITERFSLQAGYSRRIYRPRLWDLNPFFNVRNNYNIRQGNPNLQPEFADSYELTGIFIFEKASLNTSIYNLYTTEVIERVTIFEDNVNITLPMNIGTRHQVGLEVNGKYNPVNWFTVNGDFNYGVFVRNGEFEGQNFDFVGNQWSTSVTTRFKLPASFEFEVSGDYNSSYKTVQGNVSGFAFANLGVRKKLWGGKAVIDMSIRDIFASRIRESFVDQPTFQTYSFSQRGRFITLGFSYSFGKGEAMTYSGRRR
ncbi:MAG: TonB-dependent receptor [Flavobacteriia bacterium]|nr:TonB-dependent receptor [Flavobacteriia bacterium]